MTRDNNINELVFTLFKPKFVRTAFSRYYYKRFENGTFSVRKNARLRMFSRPDGRIIIPAESVVGKFNTSLEQHGTARHYSGFHHLLCSTTAIDQQYHHFFVTVNIDRHTPSTLDSREQNVPIRLPTRLLSRKWTIVVPTV